METNWYAWPNAGWWAAKEARAEEMSDAALLYSIRDAKEAVEANPFAPGSGRYVDEMCIFRRELNSRRDG